MPETLPRVAGALVQRVMFIRPKRPDDHSQFEWLLPRCRPMFVYADENGRDWVRWSLPIDVANALGWDMKCVVPGCGCTEPHTLDPQNAYLIDTAYDEVDWYLEREVNA